MLLDTSEDVYNFLRRHEFKIIQKLGEFETLDIRLEIYRIIASSTLQPSQFTGTVQRLNIGKQENVWTYAWDWLPLAQIDTVSEPIAVDAIATAEPLLALFETNQVPGMILQGDEKSIVALLNADVYVLTLEHLWICTHEAEFGPYKLKREMLKE